MEGEIRSFVKICTTVVASLTYCYFISKNIPKGFPRLLSVLPVISIFLYLPLNLSSMHLMGFTGFFISWLASFKLLLFAFDGGPLSSSSLSLPLFISISCFPIKIKHENPSNHARPPHDHHEMIKKKKQKYPSSSSFPNDHQTINTKSSYTQNSSGTQPNTPLNYAIKCLLMVILICSYDYRQYMHPNIILLLYCFHIYLILQISQAMITSLVQFLFGLELEPQFNHPFLSTSLQDFWGRRWNLMVSNILRSTVYEPVRSIFTRIVGRRCAGLVGSFVTFTVSGVMHELLFFYFCRVWPPITWEVMSFFLLHGICMVMEIEVKRYINGKWRLHRLISGPLTVGFVIGTFFWLFLPQFLRCRGDVRAIKEYAIVWEFLKVVVCDIWAVK